MPSPWCPRRAAVVPVALLVVMTTSLAATPPVARAGVGTLPQHFGLGVKADVDENGIDGWMPGSGVGWDYAYEYLSGGVGTGDGWETWNAGARYPLLYARAAAARGYVPVLSYYELAQSIGPCGTCAEDRRDLAHLNAPATMAAYYANFATLMQRLGPGTYGGIAGFGQTAIVHVEPDLAGYAQAAVRAGAQCYGYCTGQGSDPALLRASVASAGYAPVAAYPDTYQGFNWALLHLRDLYAPNVLLAFHVSGWATGQDIDTSDDPGLDPAALGTLTGTFAAQSGVTQAPGGTSTYDLLFNDVSDRDAGYYQVVEGDASHWWDRRNVAYPSFRRWEQYLGAAVAAAGGKPAFVWQIPIGNQYFQSEDNTPGHYQDNRAEYFLGHVDELLQIGVVGLLFGAGNEGSTVNYDGQGDGVTNPAPVCTTRGLSSGQVCTDHASAVTDDDGGYLRQAAAAYYAAPRPLPAAPPSPSPSSPVSPGPSPPASPPPSPSSSASPVPVPSSAPCGQRLGDVPAADPACVAIEALAGRGIINGCDPSAQPLPRFCPAESTLRHQLAALIVRAMPGWQAETWPNSFTDPTEDAELWRRVATLQHYGVVGGYTAESCAAQGKAPPCYGPLDPVLKAQAISFVTRAMVAQGYWTQQPTDPNLYGGALLGTGHEQDATTYWYYTEARGGVPDYPKAGRFPVGEAAPRGWFARLLWTALQDTPAAGTTSWRRGKCHTTSSESGPEECPPAPPLPGKVAGAIACLPGSGAIPRPTYLAPGGRSARACYTHPQVGGRGRAPA